MILTQAQAQNFAAQMERLRATSPGGLFDAVELVREGRDVPRAPYVRDASEPEIVQPWVVPGIHKPLTIIEAAPDSPQDAPGAPEATPDMAAPAPAVPGAHGAAE